MSSLNVYRVEELSRDELEEIAEIYDQAYPETGIDADALADTADSHRQQFYVLSIGSGEDEKYIASGRIDFNYQGLDTELSEAAVRPELQGNGVGKALFNIRNSRAEDLSQGRVYTWASTENTGTQAIALQNGYVPAGVELNGTAPESDETVQNVLMISPETLQTDQGPIYTTESTHDAINSLLDGTRLGETLSREVEQLEPEYGKDLGYMVSSEEMGTTTVSLGITGLGDQEREIDREQAFRKVATGPVEEAMNIEPFDNNKQVSLNVSSPETAVVSEELVEKGYVPTALLPQSPKFEGPLSPDATRDEVLFEPIEEVQEINTIEEIGEWLEGTEIPAETSN